MKSIKIPATLGFLTLMFLLLCLPSTVLSVSFKKIMLPGNATGPVAIAFSPGTRHFYTAVANGRILKYMDTTDDIISDFETVLNMSDSLCDLLNADNPLSEICRMIMDFVPAFASLFRTNELYFCDAYLGFGVLSPKGGLAKILSTSAEGERYRFCNAMDIDQQTGDAYFTDASANYDIRQIEEAVRVNDSTGRLMKYDFKKKQVTVLYRNLSWPAGVAIDKAATFVIVSEFITGKTIKIWLRQPNTNKTKPISFEQMPGKIKRTATGNFWLAAAKVKQGTLLTEPIGQLIDASGTAVLKTVNFEQFYGNQSISEVQEYDGKLYIGSMTAPFIGVYKP